MKIKIICLGCVASLLLTAGTVLASGDNVFKKTEEKEKTSSEVVETYNFGKRDPVVTDLESDLPDFEDSDELPDEEPVSAPASDVPGKITEDDTLVDENWTDFY